MTGRPRLERPGTGGLLRAMLQGAEMDLTDQLWWARLVLHPEAPVGR